MASPMNAFMDWMDKHFMPIATKIGSQRHLVALRDGFISIMPITMVGSIATLLNVFLRDLPNSWWGEGNAFTAACSQIIAVDGNVWNGSLAILALAFAFSFGYHLSKSYDVNPIAGGVVSFSALMTSVNYNITFDYALDGVKKGSVAALKAAGLNVAAGADGTVSLLGVTTGGISTAYTSATGLFTAIIFGLVCTMIYIKLMKSRFTIKLPDSVPPAVNDTFKALIPGVVAVFVSGIATQVCVALTGEYPNTLIVDWIQRPLLGMSQSVFLVVLTEFLMQLLWFFGIHGSNVMAPITEGIYTPALLENLQVWNTTHSTAAMPYIWTRGSFDAYTMMGGSGITIGLILAIMIFSKREDSRAVAKLAAPMGVFNINEPVIFGMPIVLNPIYFIPWVLVPVVTALVALGFTAAGIIPPVYIQVPWIMPVGIYAYLATGGSIAAGLVALLCLAISFAIWTPFVLLANREQDKEQAAGAQPADQAELKAAE